MTEMETMENNNEEICSTNYTQNNEIENCNEKTQSVDSKVATEIKKTNFDMSQIEKSLVARTKKNKNNNKKKPSTVTPDDDCKAKFDSSNLCTVNEVQSMKRKSPDMADIVELVENSSKRLEEILTAKMDYLINAIEKKISDDQSLSDKLLDETMRKNIDSAINDIRIRTIDEIRDLKNFVISKEKPRILELMSNADKNSGSEIIVELELGGLEDYQIALNFIAKNPDILETFNNMQLCELLRIISMHNHGKSDSSVITVINEILMNINVNSIPLENLNMVNGAIASIENWKDFNTNEFKEALLLVTILKRKIVRKLVRTNSVRTYKSK